MSSNEMTDYMGFRDLLSDEEKLVQKPARDFVNKEVIPIKNSPNTSSNPGASWGSLDQRCQKNTTVRTSPMSLTAS